MKELTDNMMAQLLEDTAMQENKKELQLLEAKLLYLYHLMDDGELKSKFAEEFGTKTARKGVIEIDDKNEDKVWMPYEDYCYMKTIGYHAKLHDGPKTCGELILEG